MVDPNRKINHLTEEDVKYLNECENEFKDRFTESDEEFRALCNKPVSDPPIVTPWMTHRSSNAGSSSYRGHRSGNYNQRPYHRSNRGGGNYNRNYNHNDGDSNRRGTKRPYNYNYNSGNDNSGKYNKRDYN